MATLDSVSEEMEIDAPIERVFDALSSAEQLDTWWGSSDSYRTGWAIDLRPGGKHVCRARAGETEMFVRGQWLDTFATS